MGKIATYPIVTPKGDDKVIVSQTTGTPQDATKNITLDGLGSFIGGAGIGIPKPEMFVIKRKFIYPLNPPQIPSPEEQWGLNHQLCIKGLVGANQSWLDPAKEARLFMYTKKPVKQALAEDGVTPINSRRKGGWTHPSHLNGAYIQTRFGNTNWGRGVQHGLDPMGLTELPLPDIVTEWDIATELKILGTGAAADFSDPTLRETTAIQVPFNQCQFLVQQNPPFSTIDDLNYPIGIDMSKNKIRNAVRPTKASSVGGYNTNTPFDAGGDLRISNKVVMRFVIGIVNPAFTLTNHTIPYIFGEPSNPVTLVYQTDFSDFIQKSVITTGHNQSTSRRIG